MNGLAMLIGADEVACEDVSHPLDYNADGIVNYGEFELFSRAWLTHDPNDPQMPPGIDPNDFVHWDSRCDLNGDYNIDLDDLMIFSDSENGYWLWQACWRDSQELYLFGTIFMSGGEVASEAMMDSLSTRQTSQTIKSTPEKTVRQQILEPKAIVNWLETLWLHDPNIQEEIDEIVWFDFMYKVYESVIELKQEQSIEK